MKKPLNKARCKGILANGKRCSLRTEAFGYCHLHQGKNRNETAIPEEEPPLPPARLSIEAEVRLSQDLKPEVKPAEPPKVEAPPPPPPLTEKKPAWETLEKWWPLLIPVIAAFIALLGWNYTSGYYAKIGAPELAPTMFTRDPLHFPGIIVFAFASFVPAALLIESLFLHLIPSKKQQYEKHIQVFVMLMSWICIISPYIYMHILGCIGNDYNAGLAIFMLAFISAIFITATRIVDKGYPRILSQVACSIGGIVLILSYFISFAEGVGNQAALSMLQGKPDYSKNIVLQTTQKIGFLSSYVGELKISDQSWIYWSKDLQASSDYSPSLQYLGSDDNYAYLIDIVADSVHKIPRSSVIELTLFESSNTTALQIEAQVNTLRSSIPTPTPLPPTSTPIPSPTTTLTPLPTITPRPSPTP